MWWFELTSQMYGVDLLKTEGSIVKFSGFLWEKGRPAPRMGFIGVHQAAVLVGKGIYVVCATKPLTFCS